MTQSFLTLYILPRLCHQRLDQEKRRKLLKLLAYLMEYHARLIPSIANTPHAAQPLLNFDAVNSIIQGLTLSLCQCLTQQDVNEEVIISTFVCAMHLANSSVPIEGSAECLLEWSDRTINKASGKSMVYLCKAEVDAAYAWIFFQWLHCIAALVTRTDHGFKDELLLLRRQCGEYIGSQGRGLGEEPLELTNVALRIEEWQSMLGDFESFLFPSKCENLPSAINVYANKASTIGMGGWKGGTTNIDTPMEPWVPSSATRRSAKEYIAAIVAIS
jgi:hypothetical protein